MKEQQVTLSNPAGLHARPGKELVQLAKGYECDVMLIKDGNRYNAKSLMKLLQAGLSQGDSLTVETNGSDEEQALTAIIDYINNLEE
ncbi:HPr family phosphocarrier protein [Suttonella ornithocola]|uniref:Phosphocarrier protein HPr n=1 Tax=Suttonella ornithocola TaxID=279832 RepID=A0A380MWY4_9GAMM|nr:HPr family phosphocarrier protein [Suttonella ornithocola]SUO97095.1 Phosphocarrier protein HPr [Suttonella ornithocola]